MVHNGNDGADERKEDGMYGGNVDSVNNGSGDVEGATNTECSMDGTFRSKRDPPNRTVILRTPSPLEVFNIPTPKLTMTP